MSSYLLGDLSWSVIISVPLFDDTHAWPFALYSQDQIDQFRFLHRRREDQGAGEESDEEDDGKLVDNFRPPLEVGARTVRSSAMSVRSRQ